MKVTDLFVFENDAFVVVNKPAGLLSIPDRAGTDVSLKIMLKAHYGAIFTVHRLDRETSGLIVFAKNEAAHTSLSLVFEGREVDKHYSGLVLGAPAPPAGSVDAAISEHPVKKGTMVTGKKGKPSVTDYETVEAFRLYSWLRFRIHTGRTHQIRVHMKHIGHPVVCDPLYGDGKPVLVSEIKKKDYHLSKKEDEEKPLLARLALHAAVLSFTLTGHPYQFEAPLPKDLKAVLQQLRKSA